LICSRNPEGVICPACSKLLGLTPPENPGILGKGQVAIRRLQEGVTSADHEG